MAGVRWATVIWTLCGPPGQVARLGHAVRIGHADGGAELERGEDVALERVVRQAGQHAEAVALAQAELLALPGHEVSQRAVQAHDALGHAGRPGGERQARGVVGPDASAGRHVRLVGPRLVAGPRRQLDHGAVGVLQPRGHRRIDRRRSGQAQQRARSGQGQARDQAGPRIRRIQNQHRGAGLEPGHHRPHQRRRARGPDARRAPLRARRPAARAGDDGQAVAGRLQLGVAPRCRRDR